jgi:phytoene dehydrogenase-like protein/ABC-type polar amino acid transport system ATPase subunit
LRRRMQMIFQDPMSSLNPRHTIGRILVAPVLLHGLAPDHDAALALVQKVLDRVGLPKATVERYSHELSGGQRQRVGIARAVVLRPDFVLADEIVSGLDVSTQAQVLRLLDELKREMHLALAFISHDLSVVRTICDRVVVINEGTVVEEGECGRVFTSPQSNYTRALIDAVPLPVPDPSWLFRDASAEVLATKTGRPIGPANGRGAMHYDAIIVGAGINGLAAAVHLAAKGWKVVVLERADAAGGAVKTGEITLPGFRHDLYAMNLSLFAGSPFFAAHKDRLLGAGLALIGAERCFATAFPDGTWLGVERDLEATAARIAALSPADAQKWRRMVSAFGSDAPHIFALLGSPMPSLQALRAMWKAWRANGAAWVADMVRLLLTSPRAWLDANFENDKLKTMMAVWGMHLDFSPDVAGGALFPYLESMANQSFGMALGQGGADTIVSAMVRAIENAGGEVRLGAEVASIDIENGAAKGVTLASGERLAATRAVIADIHPRVLFGRLLAAPSSDATEQLAKLRPGPGTMMIHLALSDLPNWSAGAELKNFSYVHLAPSLAAMVQTYTEALAGLLPVEPALVVGQPTAIDPSRAPPGRHVLWVQVRVLPFQIRGDAAGRIAGLDWDAVKESYADRVLDLIERYAPGLRSSVLARTVLSPLDLERENPNLVGGDSLSGSHHLDQNFLFRPAFGWSRYRTPIKSLYMVGASTWPGAGTGAASGFMLAKALAGA